MDEIVEINNKCTVLLNTIGKVKRFVTITSHFSTEVYLKINKYIVDAKSIMGIFSLDLTRPLEMEFETNDTNKCDKEMIKRYKDELKEFIIEEV